MGKLASKTSRRIMALLLSVTMIMSNMTVYASEYSEFERQTESPAENTESGAAELVSTENETDVNLSEQLEPEELEQKGVYNNIEAEEFNEGTHTIWVVGDSTVCAFTDAYYYPRYGYGTQIENYLLENSGYTVNNLALSGRSSKSFLSEGNYTTLKNGIAEGDVLIVGFGHNDEKDEADRYTNPNGTWETEGSFAKSLYDNYVKIAEDAKAEVILCTPIVRRSKDSDTLSDSECHITGTKVTNGVTYAGGDYPKAIRDLGTAKNVPVVDMTALTKALYEELGYKETLNLHAWTSNKEGSVDNTHLNIYGAKYVAWLFAQAAADTNTEFAKHINKEAAKPTKDKDLVSNPDYKPPVYSNDLADSKNWKDYTAGKAVFKGTAFGQLNGNFNAANYKIEADADGNMYVAALNDKSKIDAGADGMAMYYYRVPAGETFTFSARATVEDIASHAQVAFGLIARDDMYIDTNESTISSDYVAAGSLGKGSNCFYRRSGALNATTSLTTEEIKAGNSYDLSIVYNGDGYACTFGKEPTQSGGYDFQLTSVDEEYVYIGMFATRNAKITYSDIYLKVGDEELADTRKTYYDVTVSDDGNGTGKSNKSSAAAGMTVTLEAKPNAGYVFKEWQVVSGGVTITDNSFTMPENAVEVKAIFEKMRTEWDFPNDETIFGADNGVVIEGKKDTVAGITIDATAEGAKWDSKNTTNGYVQINKDTVLEVPVQGTSKVSVEFYDTNYTVDGQEATAKTGSFTCEGKNDIVTIKATADTWLKSIKVEALSYISEGSISFAMDTDLSTIKGLKVDGLEAGKNAHGLQGVGKASMTLSLSGKANITVMTCCYGAGTALEMTSTSGDVSKKEVLEETEKYGLQYTILGAEGDTVLEFTVPAGAASSGIWIPSLLVEYVKEIAPRTKIDVWDFGAKEETNTELYNNNITAAEWLAYKSMITSGGVPNAGDYNFGDVTIMGVQANDRLYSNAAGLDGVMSAGTNYAGKTIEGDDYVAAGLYYANGTGGANRRYLSVENVLAGDKIVLYMGTSNSSSDKVHFAGQGAASEQDDTFTLSESIQKQEFIAKYSGTYKIYAEGPSGAAKPMYYRVMRIPGVNVSGTVNLNGIKLPEGYSLSFVNQTTNGVTVANLTNNENGEITFTASLAPGYTYKAALVGATGYGFTNTSAIFTVANEEILTGKSGITLVVEEKSSYTFSGKINGFASDYARLNDLKIIMTPPATSTDDKIELDITKDDDGNMTFNSTLSPDVEYSIVLVGVNDYEVIDPKKIQKLADDNETSYENRTITVAPKARYNVTGGFMYLDDAEVTALTFTNGEDNYVYDATINSSKDGYSVKLRDGEYLAKATVENYSTKTHVVVNGGAVSKDLMFVSTVAKTSIPYVADIYVGYPDKDNNYETVSEAMEACELMERSGDNKDARITVHIAPGTYREQIIVNAPNVSFVNDSTDGEEVLLTWYYGIGYKYYSASGGGNSFYDAQNAYDKYQKNIASKWGTAVYVKSTATSFRAEGITFENSFNRYVTEEELADGVEVSGGESITFVRNLTSDVTSKAATERATAIAIEANQAEFKDCSFYSSQDTLYTAGSAYFKNCIIEGQTDYIFGSGNCVFDSCELSWKGYSIGGQGGYITANRPNSGELGYLFRNCTVTANVHNSLPVVAGDWGRPWGQDATVKFMNTKLQSAGLITSKGWSDMSGATAAKANFSEYNTTAMDGTEVKPGSTRPVMTDAEAAAVKVKDYFGTSWTPSYYTEDNATTVEIEGDLTLSDNGDINYVLPGHTLEVGYTLNSDANNDNDASIVRWYTVKYDESGTAGTPKLVKTANGAIDKTYKVSKTDIGSYIKVTVTPGTVNGTTGTAKEFTLYKDGDIDHIVNDGYYDPSTGSSSALGDGINIFLAGDSTTKDYSENGLYQSGKASNLGSWGEFLQTFFDESEVKIQNYANGGRSTRSFINEGSLDKIKDQIGAGDYLFIQFAHNDSSAISSKKDVYVPLGEPDDNGIYPYTAGEKVNGKYPDYAVSAGATESDNGTATYKWFLQQYVDMALDAGATPVLLTPVARMYVNDSDGKMKDHHKDEGSKKQEAFGYCKAVEQVYNDYKAEGKNVLFIDAYAITAGFYTDAWNETDKNALNKQVMSLGDATHSNKLGGMLTAAAYAQELQKMNISISEAVKAPSKVNALTVADVSNGTTAGNTVFNVDENGNFTAYDLTKNCSERAEYWEGIGTAMFTAIKAKADELSNSTEEGAVATPTAALSAEPDESGNVESGTTVTLSCTTEGAKIYFTTDGSNPVVSKTKEEYVAGTTTITLTKDVTIKAYATKTDMKDSKVAVFKYTLAPLVKAPTSNIESGTAVVSGTVIKLQTATTTEGVQIRYTMGTNPADPTRYSTRYDAETGIEITADTTIKAIAVVGNNVSTVSTFTYTIDTAQSTVKPAAPTSDTANGKVKKGKVIKLSTATSGAIIYYTMGDAPADPTISNADIYTESGISINSSVKIKAVAIKDGVSSDVAEFSYTVEAGGNESGDEDITTNKTGGIEIDGLKESYPYTGAKVTPDFTVVDNGIIVGGEPKVLTLGIDYTVKYTNNSKPGTATVTVVGKGNYVGKTVTATFKIEEVNKVEAADLADLTGAKLDKIDAQPYTGEPCYPNFKLTLKGKQPVEYHYDSEKEQYVKSDDTTDVNVALSNNINKGTATILITGKMGPKKVTSVKKTFKINAVDLSAAGNKLTVTVADGEASVPYAVKGATPKVEVSYKFNNDEDAVPLVNGKDYTVKYSANKKPGTGTVTITGKGNYAKKSTKTFKIDTLDMSNTELVAVAAYEGLKAGKVKATVVDANGDMLKASQYNVKVYKDEAGTQEYNAADVLKKGDTIYVKADVKDAKNLKSGTATEIVEFTVGENIAKAKVKLNIKSKVYTGAAIELENADLSVTIKGASAPLKLKPADADSDEGYDYEIVSYSNNINKGTATAVIKGIGKYSGTKTVKFKIVAKEMKKQTTTNN